MIIDFNKIPFFKFLNYDITIEDFEQWIYENKELERIFQKDHYIDLISFNYKSNETRNFIKSMVKKQFDWNEFEKWRTIELLKKIIANEIEIVLATRKLRQLYLEQEDEIEKPYISIGLGIGFESCLDECPIESEYHLWNKDALNRQLELIRLYEEDFLKTVQSELNEMNKF